mgnify:CR=1 FL=1
MINASLLWELLLPDALFVVKNVSLRLRIAFRIGYPEDLSCLCALIPSSKKIKGKDTAANRRRKNEYGQVNSARVKVRWVKLKNGRGPLKVSAEENADQATFYAGRTVLVIDDQIFVRRAIMQMIRQMGFTAILEAQDGESGLKKCRENNPDIVLCDIEMRPMNGLQFLAALRSLSEEDGLALRSRIPVIFLTNHTESDIIRQATDLGVDGFVVKPPSAGALKERLDRLLTIAAAGTTPPPPEDFPNAPEKSPQE